MFPGCNHDPVDAWLRELLAETYDQSLVEPLSDELVQLASRFPDPA